VSERSARMPSFVYLASQSPRRAQLLDQLGIAHVPLLSAPDEDAEALEAIAGHEAPAHYVQRVTALKLDAALVRRAGRGLEVAPVLCADTTVAVGHRILGKPADAHDARRMLQLLSGTTHEVHTAVAIQHGRRAEKREAILSTSRVRFAAWTDAQIDAYVAGGEPMGKAGAYAVQGRAAAFIEHMEGSYSGIMGLPMYETAHLLRCAGFKL